MPGLDPLQLGATGVRHVLLVLALRTFPFVGYALASRAVSRGAAAISLGVFGLLGLGLTYIGLSSTLGFIAAGVAFYLAFSLVIHRLPVLLRERKITQGTTFLINCVGYLVVPALIFPRTWTAAFLVYGWDLVLSGYSYCVEIAREHEEPPLGVCLFFLLVNPTLVYSARGYRAHGPGLDAAGLLRLCVGASCIFASVAFLRPATRMLLDQSVLLPWVPNEAVAQTLAGALGFMGEYARHSGLAGIQIGLMRQTGHVVPERYRYPLLASSPLDFWRRWNTYVGTWLRVYVFLPLSRSRGTRRAGVVRRAALLSSLLVTFLASAALHDGYAYLSSPSLSFRFTRFFFSVFLFVVAWSVALGVYERLRKMVPLLSVPWIQAVTGFVPRAVMLAFITMSAAHWG